MRAIRDNSNARTYPLVFCLGGSWELLKAKVVHCLGCVREGMKQNWCGLIWINPGIQNFEKAKKNKDLATSPDIRVVVFFVFLVRSSRKEEVTSQSENLRRTKHCEDDNFAVRVRRLRSSGWRIFVVRVRQQTADIGCLVYQMIRPTHTGCFERKKTWNHP